MYYVCELTENLKTIKTSIVLTTVLFLFLKIVELHSRVLSALDEANSNSQAAREPEENTSGIVGLLTNIFNSSSTQENEFDRKTEEGKLVSNLKQTSELLTRIVRVSMLCK